MIETLHITNSRYVDFTNSECDALRKKIKSFLVKRGFIASVNIYKRRDLSISLSCEEKGTTQELIKLLKLELEDFNNEVRNKRTTLSFYKEISF